MEYYSVINKKEILPFSNMDGPWGPYAKWRKSDKDKYYLDVKSKKNKLIEMNRLVVARGRGQGMEKIGQ